MAVVIAQTITESQFTVTKFRKSFLIRIEETTLPLKTVAGILWFIKETDTPVWVNNPGTAKPSVELPVKTNYWTSDDNTLEGKKLSRNFEAFPEGIVETVLSSGTVCFIAGTEIKLKDNLSVVFDPSKNLPVYKDATPDLFTNEIQSSDGFFEVNIVNPNKKTKVFVELEKIPITPAGVTLETEHGFSIMVGKPTGEPMEITIPKNTVYSEHDSVSLEEKKLSRDMKAQLIEEIKFKLLAKTGVKLAGVYCTLMQNTVVVYSP